MTRRRRKTYVPRPETSLQNAATVPLVVPGSRHVSGSKREDPSIVDILFCIALRIVFIASPTMIFLRPCDESLGIKTLPLSRGGDSVSYQR